MFKIFLEICTHSNFDAAPFRKVTKEEQQKTRKVDDCSRNTWRIPQVNWKPAVVS